MLEMFSSCSANFTLYTFYNCPYRKVSELASRLAKAKQNEMNRNETKGLKRNRTKRKATQCSAAQHNGSLVIYYVADCPLLSDKVFSATYPERLESVLGKWPDAFFPLRFQHNC